MLLLSAVFGLVMAPFVLQVMSRPARRNYQGSLHVSDNKALKNQGFMQSWIDAQKAQFIFSTLNLTAISIAT